MVEIDIFFPTLQRILQCWCSPVPCNPPLAHRAWVSLTISIASNWFHAYEAIINVEMLPYEASCRGAFFLILTGKVFHAIIDAARGRRCSKQMHLHAALWGFWVCVPILPPEGLHSLSLLCWHETFGKKNPHHTWLQRGIYGSNTAQLWDHL